MPRAEPSPSVLTIGHSTRTLEEFTSLLQAHAVSRVVDVRTVPRSRHNPQFNKDSLPGSWRKPGWDTIICRDSAGCVVLSPIRSTRAGEMPPFEVMRITCQTPDFEQSLEELIRLANLGRIALMCAEAVPWRCHRSLIADALLVRGIRIENIMSPNRRQVHTLTPFAKVRGTTITYPTERSRSTQKKPSVKRSRSQPVEKI